MKPIIAIIMILGLCYPTVADEYKYYSGVELLRGCKLSIKWTEGEKLGYDDASKASVCVGYVQGVLDTYAGFHKESQLFCMPNGVTTYQVMRILIKYLNENPEMLHDDAMFLILSGLRNVYPCGE